MTTVPHLRPSSSPRARVRPTVRGKFLWLGERKLHVKGVTYGTFRPRDDGADYPEPEQIDRDFAAMAAAGFNTVRTYTVPPREVLDLAHAHGLLVMVGLPWEQHVAFLDDRGRAAAIEGRVREAVRACGAHPAVLCFTIGNEIPAPIVRWHGRRRVERFLKRLYLAVKDEDPGALVTYVNFPTTEYLDLSFLDFVAFNVYLEQEERLEAYLARLQVVAGDRPLVMAEIGLDSRSNGEDVQGDALCWQLRSTFRAGCAGALLFAWTDEWHRGGFDIDDWDFGLVRRDRTPKPALARVTRALAELPPAPAGGWPRISVVVCSHNGARTIGECLEAVAAADYPSYEVVVVDDGSTDGTGDIARAHGARVISTENRGLSSARNTGARAATGEIVSFLDDDAYPDPDWLRHMATTFRGTDHAAVGGPNLSPPGDGATAQCVDSVPGNPIHVLLSDTVAEHVPGCNMSVRRAALLDIGGFDTRFRIAGDDVDVCWRLQERGWTIGFSPAAMVWHHRRPDVRSFLRQQRNYGRAEAMLERKWPEKYNALGHVGWAGRIYTPSANVAERWRVYYGTWGTGFFQRVYSEGPPARTMLPAMPEWLLLVALLAYASALGFVWPPMFAAVPALVVTVLLTVNHAVRSALRAPLAETGRLRRARMRALVAVLHPLQAGARLWGRLTYGLAPWRRRPRRALRLPVPRTHVHWSESWGSVEDRLCAVEERIQAEHVRVQRGGDFDRWDLDVPAGAFGGVRVRMALEEHGAGRQQLRFRTQPAPRRAAVVAVLGVLAAAGVALADGSGIAAAIFVVMAAVLTAATAYECAAAAALAERASRPVEDEARVEATEPEPEPVLSPLEALEAAIEETLRHGKFADLAGPAPRPRPEREPVRPASGDDDPVGVR